MYSNRISTAARYDLLTKDIQKSEANFNRLTAQLASGKKITSINEDPVGAVNIINTNRQLGQIETFNKNIGMGMQQIQTMDDLLELAGGYLSTAWDKAVQANNGTYGVSSLEALKVEIDEITKTMVDLANTQFNDSFVFGGANSKITPYTIDENGDIVYNGTPYSNPEYAKKTEVADGVYEVVNTTGDKVFGYYRSEVADGNDVFTAPDGRRVIKDGDVYKYENGNLYNTGLDGSDLTAHYDENGNIDYYLSPENKKVIKEEATGTREVTTTVYNDENGNQYAGDITSLNPVTGEDGVYTDDDGNRYTAEDVTSTETYTYDVYNFQDGGLYGHGKDNTGLGSATEQSEGILGTLRKLSNAIQTVIDGKNSKDANLEQAGYKDMNATLDMFKKSLDTITTEQTKFGGVYNRMEMTESTLETNNENLTSYLSELQDVDLAKAISDWYQAQYAYQASLQIASQSMNMSLLNYM